MKPILYGLGLGLAIGLLATLKHVKNQEITFHPDYYYTPEEENALTEAYINFGLAILEREDFKLDIPDILGSGDDLLFDNEQALTKLTQLIENGEVKVQFTTNHA